ncbi:LysR substrate-binding domain-containing protein [Glutamicibacter uratoxydans]|uniref:LysR substrate-binding domain-containing protein n=1 Tax=Glutamicibacter uratoxydans TaxID=43667 RepID=UPI003D6EE2FE
MFEMRRLRLLRELSIRGTIVDVAFALSYSPSSVSQQLSLLEAEAGVKLLQRNGRTLALTPQAQVLVAHTETLLDSMERAEADLKATLSAVSGTVRLAAFQTAMLAIMPTALRRLRAEFPQLRVELSQQEPEHALSETALRNFDLVVAEQYPGHAAKHFENLDRRTLTHDAIRLALPAVDPTDISAFDRVNRIEEAAFLPWVMEPVGAASRHWAEQACRLAGFEPDVRYETADLQAQVQLVESGNAVALLPDLVWAQRPRQLRIIDLPGAPVRTVFTAMRHASERNPAITAVRECLHDQARLLPSPHTAEKNAAIVTSGTNNITNE